MEVCLSITNQDMADLTMQFEHGPTVPLRGAYMDPITGVHVPVTTTVCVPADSGEMTLKYTRGNRCVHRTFAPKVWAALRTFGYTVPAWGSGRMADVCQGSQHAVPNNAGDVVHANGEMPQVLSPVVLCAGAVALLVLALLLLSGAKGLARAKGLGLRPKRSKELGSLSAVRGKK